MRAYYKIKLLQRAAIHRAIHCKIFRTVYSSTSIPDQRWLTY